MHRKADKKKIHIVPDKAGYLLVMLLTIAVEIALLFFVMLLDILPAKYIIALLILIIGIDVVAFLLLASRKKASLKPMAGMAICFAFCIIMLTGSIYLYSTFDTFDKINVAEPQISRDEKGIDVTYDPYNIFISGSDSRVGIEENARSDVNMIMTVNPQTNTILLTSMPRDSYVPLHMNGEMDKLTHAGVYGIDESIGTVEDFIGVDIDYYLKADFNMVVNLVNSIGGIDVYSDVAFKSAVTSWTYEKGWNHCTGKKALYFARERKAFKKQDQKRIKNQQKVLKAILKKVTTNKKLVIAYPSMMNAVENDMQTDFSRKNISKLAKMQLNDMPKWKIKTQAVKGEDTMRGTWSMGPGRELLVCIPDQESVAQVRKGIEDVMNPPEDEDSNN